MPTKNTTIKEKTQEESMNGRLIRGVVVSDKMQKTVVVAVTRLVKHPKYKKYYKVTRRFKAHDEQGLYHTGDKVTMQETRPLSKDKRWTVISKQ
jgi:small subunit ribosomal protein S17